jgi:hypothetical protein
LDFVSPAANLSVTCFVAAGSITALFAINEFDDVFEVNNVDGSLPIGPLAQLSLL